MKHPNPDESWPHAAILVVDDEPGMRNFLLKALQTRAGRVAAVESAEQAEAELQRHRFDLVILDITLPGMDPAAAQALIDAAHQVCPYSNATRGNIDVTIALR